MTWAAKYDSKFVEKLIDNLLEYVKTNAAAALTWANGGAGLSDFASRLNSTAGLEQTTFPNLMLVSARAAILEAEDESEIRETIQLVFMVEYSGTADATTTTRNFFRYMNATDSMFRKIPKASLMSGMTGTQHGCVEVTSHDYGVLRKLNNVYFRSGLMTVQIEMSENRIN